MVSGVIPGPRVLPTVGREGSDMITHTTTKTVRCPRVWAYRIARLEVPGVVRAHRHGAWLITVH